MDARDDKYDNPPARQKTRRGAGHVTDDSSTLGAFNSPGGSTITSAPSSASSDRSLGGLAAGLNEVRLNLTTIPEWAAYGASLLPPETAVARPAVARRPASARSFCFSRGRAAVAPPEPAPPEPAPPLYTAPESEWPLNFPAIAKEKPRQRTEYGKRMNSLHWKSYRRNYLKAETAKNDEANREEQDALLAAARARWGY